MLRLPMYQLGLSPLILIILGYLSINAFGIGPVQASAPQLSAAERAWIAAHPSIQVGICGNCPPIEFIDEAQQYQGITSDYSKLISIQLNIRMPLFPAGKNWSDVLALARKGEIDLLSAGKVDAYSGNLVVGSYLIGQQGLTNVKVGAPTPYRFELRIGVRKDWPELIPILQRILDGLGDEQRFAIRQKWLRLQTGPRLDRRLLWQLALGASGVLLLAALWLLQMRRQREALRQSEARYHAAMEAVSEAVWEWDLSTGKRYFSAGFFYRLGYRQEEIPTTNEAWLGLMHPQDVEYVQSRVQQHNASQNRHAVPLILEFRIRNKLGEYVTVQSIGQTMARDKRGNVVLRRGTLRDISEQQQAESELRKLSQAVEHSPVMVIITDAAGMIEYVNPKFTQVTGYGATEVYGKQPYFLQSDLPEAQLDPERWETLSAGQEWHGELQDRKHSGELFWASISLSVVRNAAGEITHYVAIEEDISARKEAECLLALTKQEAEQAKRLAASHAVDHQAAEYNIFNKQLVGTVLLVEDNRTNQLVAKELLERFGLQVIIAQDGGEALAYLHQYPVDLVLMDVQMPGMDGYATTRAIRTEAQYQRLPIIAMTAHAMAGDKAQCLAAGMNDYLAKPVEPLRLYTILQEWLSASPGEQAALVHQLPNAPVVPDEYQGIELAQGLRRIGGNRRLFIKLLNDFYLHHHDCCEQIEQALAAGSIEEALLLTHTLEGVAGNIGCKQLQGAARDLHRVIKQQSNQEMVEQTAHFCTQAKLTFERLASLLSSWDEQGFDLANRSRIRHSGVRNINLDIIEELFDRLQHGDPDVRVLVEALQDAMNSSATEANAQMQRLQAQITNYDYDKALITLQQLSDWYTNELKSDSHGRA